jgi:hypothetical protein
MPIADSQGRARTQVPGAKSRHSHCGDRRLGPIAAGHWHGGVANPPEGTGNWSIASAASGTPKKTCEPRSPPSWSATGSGSATTPPTILPTSRARSGSARKIPRRSCARPGCRQDHRLCNGLGETVGAGKHREATADGAAGGTGCGPEASRRGAASAAGPFCFRSGALSCGPRGGSALLVVRCSVV